MTSSRPASKARAQALLIGLVFCCGCAADSSAGLATEALTTFSVNSTADEVDVSPGDGVCEAPSGRCTLRAAIMEANAWPGPDEIHLPAGDYELTIAGSREDLGETGDLDILDEVEIYGDGLSATRILQTTDDRVIHLLGASFMPVRIKDLAILHGHAPDFGGGVRNEVPGGPRLQRVDVSQNTAQAGGGIYNDLGANMRLTEVEVTFNIAGGDGAGIANYGVMFMTHSTISYNKTLDGTAGIVAAGDVTDIRQCTIRDNWGGSPSGAWGTGVGGVRIDGRSELENVTITGNRGRPSGIWVTGLALLMHVTLTDNPVAVGNCDACGGSTTLVNSIVANDECRPEDLECASTINCIGTVTSGGHNIDSSFGCDFTEPGDMEGTNPGLLPLAMVGGPTATQELDPTSPAIDAADLGWCPFTDQRGVPRPQRAGCDIGAFELQ